MLLLIRMELAADMKRFRMAITLITWWMVICTDRAAVIVMITAL